MFGYIVFNQDELKFKEYKQYRAYYCGLCRALRSRHGLVGELTLSYDTAFLALLLSSLYEPQDICGETRCAAHPLEKHPTRTNPYVEYAADMNLLLAYHSSRDDWSDEHSVRKLALSKLLATKQARVSARYPEKAECIRRELALLHEAELTKERDLDKVSGHFGALLSEVFACHTDEWESALRRMGFFLGKFIYILDAYDDLEKDVTRGSYNPLLTEDGQLPWTAKEMTPERFAEETRMILTMMMAECCRSFEMLPILNNLEILRNILYSGVWGKYEEITARRAGLSASASEQNAAKPSATEEEGKHV